MAKKIAAGQQEADLANDLVEGADLLDRAAPGVPAESTATVLAAAAALRDKDAPLFERVSPAMDLAELLWEYPVREMVTASPGYPIWTDRQTALFSAWYEFFPRSEGAVLGSPARPARPGTFATAIDRLAGVAEMGFDVLYLPPIHPIGRVNRKGRNNALVAGDGDPGSPWAAPAGRRRP